MPLFNGNASNRNKRQQKKALAQQALAQQQAQQAQLAIWQQQIQQQPQLLPQVLTQIHQTIAAGAAAAGFPNGTTFAAAAASADLNRPDPAPQTDRPQMPLTAVVLNPDPEGLEDPDAVVPVAAVRQTVENERRR
ncbi:hypothetical protein SEUCBS140593_002337 [Sporothrix eucalyptigena]|uniref:Uncharacterized protein n=1 Tax=Sporothrix eucalyptigena TaxID=1812306 RepID=A0ABP0B5K8_9PEZI